MSAGSAAEGLYAAIAATLARRAHEVVIEAGSQQLTGAALAAEVQRFASSLAVLGVQAGARVAVQAEKSLSQVLLYLACLHVGAAYVPLNPAYGPDELAYFLGDAEPALLVSDPAREKTSLPLAAAVSARFVTLDKDGRGSFAAALHGAPALAPASSIGSADVAVIIYTSGTTGRSKGAMLTNGNLIANARALVSTWAITDRDVLLHALPLFHIHGLFVALNTLLLAGGRIRLLRSFDPATVIDGLPRATLFMGVPTYYTRLLSTGALSRTAAASVRLFVSGSAPLLPLTFADFEFAMGQRIVERYGMSECGIITSNPLEGVRKPGSVGRPLPGIELRFVDAARRPVEPGATGVIEVRGPHVCAGYWRRPLAGTPEFQPDGFFVTGDLGQVDADGYVQIVGRAKDMIISGGLNVYPKEIEMVLDALPGVVESAVFGLPHGDYGEAVAAAICADPGAAPIDVEAVLQAARLRLAGFKVPKVVFIVAELPRNAMGKVQKAELRARYAQTFQARR